MRGWLVAAAIGSLVVTCGAPVTSVPRTDSQAGVDATPTPRPSTASGIEGQAPSHDCASLGTAEISAASTALRVGEPLVITLTGFAIGTEVGYVLVAPDGREFPRDPGLHIGSSAPKVTLDGKGGGGWNAPGAKTGTYRFVFSAAGSSCVLAFSVSAASAAAQQATPAFTAASAAPATTRLTPVPASTTPATATTPSESTTPRPQPTVAPSPTPTAATTPALAATDSAAAFTPPFSGRYRMSNLVDHSVPREFQEYDGIFLSFWGEELSMFDSHSGIDWLMPEGTPILSVADGTVVFAGTGTPGACPVLNNQVVAAQSVIVEHLITTHGGVPLRVRTSYVHLSQVGVALTDHVVQGQRIGLSGNTGCSGAPHLHFMTQRQNARGTYVAFDPFGWEGTAPDPWAVRPDGLVSIPLWARAPELFAEASLAPNPGTSTASVAITDLRWLGYPDPLDPNTQFVELTIDPRFAAHPTVNLAGFEIRNNHGEAYRFPSGFFIGAQPVRVHGGKGTDAPTDLYWGRTSLAFDHKGDCARLVYPGDGSYKMSYGFTMQASPGSVVVTVPITCATT